MLSQVRWLRVVVAAFLIALLAGVNVLRIVSATAGGYAADRRAIPSAA